MADPSTKSNDGVGLSFLIIIMLLGLFLLAAFPYPFAGAGYFWDFSNALGLAGLAGLVILSLTSSKPLEINYHKILSYIVVFYCLSHALTLVFVDGAVFTYIRPGAPLYMWAGLASLVGLVILLWHAQRPLREKLHAGYQGFASWHRYLAILVIVLAAWHIIVSGFYFQRTYQIVMLAIVCGLALLRPFYASDILSIDKAAVWLYVCTSVVLIVIFIFIRNYQT